MSLKTFLAFLLGNGADDRAQVAQIVRNPEVIRSMDVEDVLRILRDEKAIRRVLFDGNTLDPIGLAERLDQEIKRLHNPHPFKDSEFYLEFIADLAAIEFLRYGFRDKRVIELGSWKHPVYQIVANLGATSYIAVEPNYSDLTKEALRGKSGQIEVVESDGLSYLVKQPSDSSVIVSFGVLPYTSPSYQRSVAGEIFRVTVPGGITVHAPRRDVSGENPYVNAGFKPLAEVAQLSGTRCDIFVKHG